MSGLNSLYVSSPDLEEYFVSNQSAEALAGGSLRFFVDSNRTQPKSVFELVQATGFPFNYSYQPLPNPMTLSNSGTPMDANGNNVAIYYYPFDQFGNQQLYYVECYDAFGNLQFTREAWPFPFGVGGGGSTAGAVGLTNMLTNPQFSQVLFIPGTTLTISYSGTSTTSVVIAPGWTINITHTGAGSLTITQNAIAGSSAYPYNPPFSLTVVAGANITALTLSQTLNNNPDWAAPQTTGVMGYLSGSILLAPSTGVSLQYLPSSGNAIQTIFTATNTSGAYTQETGTIQLQPANNSQTGAVGFDQIIINLLNTSGTSTFSNVQVIPLTTNASGVQFDQTPVNRQVDQMFNYYNPLLQYKPIPSYLVGWDFPLNPSQFYASGIVPVIASGANTSNYFWDATIVFQSANSGVSAAHSPTLGLQLTAAQTGQMALIQYLNLPEAVDILTGFSSVTVAGSASASTKVTISLWYSTDTNLPSTVASNNSIVATLDANGKPATFHGTWFEITRSNLGDATFHVGTATSNNPNIYGFTGWNLNNGTLAATATWFAIVIGTESMAQNNTISFQSISLVPGQIPTLPGQQAREEVVAICQSYYEKSFDLGTAPAQNVGVTTGEFIGQQVKAAGAGGQLVGTISFKATKRDPGLLHITTYNPAAANAQIRNESINADCSAIFVNNPSANGFYLSCTNAGGSSAGDTLGIHWVADARIGY